MVLGISPSAWIATLTDKKYKWWWGIDIEQIKHTLGLSRERVYKILDLYTVYFSSKSFTKEEFKTKYLKLNKNDDLQLDEFCDKVFQKFADENGSITFEKFARMLDKQLSGNAMDQLTLFFDITDQDSDGKISAKDLTDMLKAVYNRQGQPEPGKRADELASSLLKGSDGAEKEQISLAEFLDATHVQDTFSRIYELFHPNFNPKKPRKEGEPPLHWMLRDEQYEICLNLLLNMQNDPNWLDNDGNTALHIAAQEGMIDYVEMLIAFGADVNLENKKKFTARHLAATSENPKKNDINNRLCSVGAIQCSPDMKGCKPNCCAQFDADDIEGENPDDKFKIKFENDFETVSSDINANETEFSRDDASETEKKEETGDVVLCLDGGGVRGLVLIHTLLEIEKKLQAETGNPLMIRDCFDWIGGTSTGGILALALEKGFTTRYCRRLYFQLKDNVFESQNEETQTEQLINLLTNTFGSETKLRGNKTAKKKQKVILTSVKMGKEKTERAMLELIRNYEAPSNGNQKNKKDEVDGQEAIEHVWEAARATSAAPNYFKKVRDRYIDGGLMANNPTLDVLTDIMEYRAKIENTKKISVGAVVSLGTGQGPMTGLVPRWDKVADLKESFKEKKQLLDFLYNEATKTEGTIVSRSKAWCESIGSPYFRLNPPFKEDINLAERDNKKLIHMLWLTAAYLHQRKDEVDDVVQLLSKQIKQRHAA